MAESFSERLVRDRVEGDMAQALQRYAAGRARPEDMDWVRSWWFGLRIAEACSGRKPGGLVGQAKDKGPWAAIGAGAASAIWTLAEMIRRGGG